MTEIRSGTVRILLALAVFGLYDVSAWAESMVESSAETRFQLDLHVPERALQALMPPGFVPNIAAQGAAKGANLRAVFIDRVTINGPDGKPLGKGSNRLVYLVAPVKEPSGANVQLVVAGLTEDPTDAPGPFSVYLPAVIHTMQRITSSGITPGPIMESQDWVFTGPAGERLELHVKYERGVGNKGNPAETRFYSAKNPAFFQISRQEQVLDILRNTSTNPADRVMAFSLKAGGGSYSKLFDGTEKVLSWDNILWIHRSVLLP
jgi:hypothetical protein